MSQFENHKKRDLQGSKAPLEFKISFIISTLVSLIIPTLAQAAPLQGAYVWDIPYGARNLDAFEEFLGRKIELAQAHQDLDAWSDIEGEDWQLSGWSKWVHSAPERRLNLSMGLFPGRPDGSGPDGIKGNSDDVSLLQCSQGKYNHRYKQLANNLVKHRLQRTIIRIGWEFSGNWMPWSAIGKEALFKECFRQAVLAIRSAQPNAGFQFDWNPNQDIPEDMMWKTYPGNDVVDFIGSDHYDMNWQPPNGYPWPANCDSQCKNRHRVWSWYNVQYPRLILFRQFARHWGKPLSFPEWGVGSNNPAVGGDNPFYIQKMMEFIYDPANNVAYHAYFDADDGGAIFYISDIDRWTGARTRALAMPNSTYAFKLFSVTLDPLVRSHASQFNEVDYLRLNPDVADAVRRGLIPSGAYHYWNLGGAREGRHPGLLFHEQAYLDQNPDVAAAVRSGVFLSGFHHFTGYGEREGRAFTPVLSNDRYLKLNPDVRGAIRKNQFKSGLQHFILHGRAEGRAI